MEAATAIGLGEQLGFCLNQYVNENPKLIPNKQVDR